MLGERIFEGPVDHVAMPNIEGAAAATRHLIEQGCRRIVMIDGPEPDEVSMSNLRLQGYRRALDAAGIRYDPALVIGLDVLSMEAGVAAVRQLVASKIAFDGLFCITDTVAIGALRGLADEHISVPEAVKVIGFDNVREAAFTVPSLSSVDPDHATMAEKAVSLLARRIEDGGGSGHEEYVSSYTVVRRESTAG
ncbi:MAG: substrate-binding domain-containing protein [Pseudolysinimonas sp.]